MVGQSVLDRFIQQAPLCVMARATLEKVFAPQRLDALFQRTAVRQYERELLFSTVVDLMSLVVCRVTPSVHRAYQQKKAQIPVSIRALYDKLGHIEPATSRELVRQTASEMAELIRTLPAMAAPLLPGYRVKILDGNHLEGTEHRLKPLRTQGGGALPGQCVVLLDPQLRMILDVIPGLDAYTQECRLCLPLLEGIDPKDVVIDDRNFCTSELLFGLARHAAFFVTRQHRGRLRWEVAGKAKSLGRGDSGRLTEEPVRLTDPTTGEVLPVRRITIELDEPTRDHDSTLHLLTNLPASEVTAAQVAELYRERWTIETAFQELTTHLRCELNTLGYPPAALFGFCTALACYNVLAVVQAALASAHGQEFVDEQFSHWRMSDELSRTYVGMMIAIPADQWEQYGTLPAEALSRQLHVWAESVDVMRYRKSIRGPKTRTKRPAARAQHFSTDRLLKQRRSNTG